MCQRRFEHCAVNALPAPGYAFEVVVFGKLLASFCGQVGLFFHNLICNVMHRRAIICDKIICSHWFICRCGTSWRRVILLLSW